MSRSRAPGSNILGPHVLELDLAAEAGRIAGWMQRSLRGMRRRGLVVAMSGGIDSSVCAALAVEAVGAERVLGLLLPERDSSGESTRLGRQLAAHLGIDWRLHDIAPALEALGCYAERDAAIREVFPDYGQDWKSKIVLHGGLEGGINFYRLVVQSPDGEMREARLPLQAYLRIVAATNHKQRVRKTLEYHHADRMNHAVVGTPNRLEYDQGFFVKNGDGSADLKPIAHLYKTQVYAMARHLGLPGEICAAVPTTDTYSLPQGQDEFYFALPYAQMDLALWAHDHQCSAEELATALDITPERARAVYADIRAKRRAAAYLHAAPARLEGSGVETDGNPDAPGLSATARSPRPASPCG
ncbi:NAD(+) synthase [Marilutibacter alkalisoli]|uniref:NH(3)-dependent NAD(+) synthetase n=1 Tax=Marilutibacter alkalisoli TaxID=2591633 RepID=A0A514BRK7_9GAMM|nr:NAD(+) synthase [Lysobacter alkalisoli]QDH70017.1 NAD(+) synthase [Lysobacter alkalisoli]